MTTTYFLSRVSILLLTRDIYIVILSVRLSVSDTLVLYENDKSLYLANDTRYRHGYYGRQIGNRTQAFEWHQFQ